MEDYLKAVLRTQPEPAEENPKQRKLILYLEPQIDLQISELSVRWSQLARGQMEPHDSFQQSWSFVNKEKLYQGRNYSFPFEIPEEQIIVYKGEWMEILPQIALFVQVDPEQSPEFTSDRWEAIKQWFGTQPSPVKKWFLDPKELSHTYHLKNENKSFESKPWTSGGWFFGLVFFGMIMIQITQDGLNKWSFVLLALLIVVFFAQTIYRFLGIPLQGRVSNTYDGQMEIELSTDQNWRKVSEVKASLVIKERVEDNRGSSESVKTFPIYQSQPQTVDHPVGNFKLQFSFPENKVPSMSCGDAAIVWSIQLKVRRTNGLPLSYEFLLEVKRKRTV